VRGLEARGWVAPPLFAHGITVGGHAPEYVAHAVDYGTPSDWAQLLEEAEEVFDLMGLSLSSWERTEEGLAKKFYAKASAGCSIRLMLVHPDNPVLPHLINPEIAEEEFADTGAELRSMTAYFGGVAESHPNIEMRQIRNAYPYANLVRSDLHALYIPYLFSARSNQSPLWKCTTDSPLYETVTSEFEAMWEANAPAEKPSTTT
jgi:hypothetical protein